MLGAYGETWNQKSSSVCSDAVSWNENGCMTPTYWMNLEATRNKNMRFCNVLCYSTPPSLPKINAQRQTPQSAARDLVRLVQLMIVENIRKYDFHSLRKRQGKGKVPDELEIS